MLQSEPKIPWSTVVKFIGQLNHDLRNHLNAIELQAAFVGEIVDEPEAKGEIKRLRELTKELGAHLQRLSASLAKIQPTLMAYSAREFVEDLRARFATEQPEHVAEVEWKESLGGEMIEIDPQLLQEAFLELLANAFTHGRGEGPIVFEAQGDKKAVVFALCEPKTQFDGTMEDWAARPLAKVRQGHYALGLFRARSIFEAHHGTFRAQFDSEASLLRTTSSLPRAAH
jgi:K+-sensing histidine kinase KdpD